MTNDQINLEFDEFQKDLDLRKLKLKYVVHFNNEDEDDLLNMLKDIKQMTIGDSKKNEI